MEFLAFTLIGLGVALLHVVLPSEHRVGPASALTLGMLGAWGGALLSGTLHQGGWAIFGPLSAFGAAIGAAGAIAFFEIVAEVHVHREERSL